MIALQFTRLNGWLLQNQQLYCDNKAAIHIARNHVSKPVFQEERNISNWTIIWGLEQIPT